MMEIEHAEDEGRAMRPDRKAIPDRRGGAA